MENEAANQLPEVESLPDGFVESSTEPLAPPTPAYYEEQPHASYNGYRCLREGCLNSSESLAQSVPGEASMENIQGTNAPHVPSPEKDDLVDSVAAVVILDNDSLRPEEGALSVPEISDSACAVSLECIGMEEQAQRQSSERSTGGCSTTQPIDQKGTPSDNTENLTNRKFEPSEGKRKNTRRTFKSEKEFLECTLKYQHVLAERDAAISVRDKLESLCRELQRQNKMLLDECKRVSNEGQNLRVDFSNKFQDAIKDVSNKLEEQKDEYVSHLREKEMLKTKLNQLADQHALSEQHFAQKLKQKELELQLADLKIKQHEDKFLQEQSQMKLYAEQVSQLLSTEKNLRLQLASDGEKFQQFQEALVKSNEVFETFKQEIEKMAKSIKELKKENTFLKSKCGKSDVTLIELVEERERLKKQLEKTKNQKEKLESLCRSLQAERKSNSSCVDNSTSFSA